MNARQSDKMGHLSFGQSSIGLRAPMRGWIDSLATRTRVILTIAIAAITAVIMIIINWL